MGGNVSLESFPAELFGGLVEAVDFRDYRNLRNTSRTLRVSLMAHCHNLASYRL